MIFTKIMPNKGDMKITTKFAFIPVITYCNYGNSKIIRKIIWLQRYYTLYVYLSRDKEFRWYELFVDTDKEKVKNPIN